MTTRRTALKTGAAALAGSLLFPDKIFATGNSNHRAVVPIRAITKSPKFHWFGYYDKLQFDPTNRYVLGMEVDFEHRSPATGDEVRIGMIDLLDNDRWVDLGLSESWSWQQGCMLQWIPGSDQEIIWNNKQGDRFVCHILNVK
ncbi:MAG: hypothetical protein HC830_05955, partial [Bacteroidetes bacterium]|nr:hypothetical protein [Bacteroidota bacterium]